MPPVNILAMNTENYEIDIDILEPALQVNQRRGFLAIINEYIKKIAELKSKNKELKKITENQIKIISILAHDVRNPLASLKSVLQLKKSGILDNHETNGMIESINGQLDNTMDMVENIINWGQTNLKHGQLNPEYFHPYTIVESVFGVELLKSIEKNNQLVNKIDSAFLVLADKRAFEFILRNLVGNANKFTGNGVITVDMQQEGMKTMLTISDTGVGMTPEKVNDLFVNDVYNTTLGTKKESGSGLGLLLVKEFITRMGGTLVVESTLSKGTTFKIAL